MEIEVKARLNNFELTKRKLRKIGAEYVGKKHQVDIYYSLYKRPMNKKKGKVMRIRHDKLNHTTRFEFHLPKNTYAAEEIEVQVGDLKTMKRILKEMHAKEEYTVDKQRLVYRKRELEIVLDKVKGLGNFIEVELQGKDTLKNRKKVDGILISLGISKDDVCHGFHSKYHSMMARKQGKKYAYF